jgi:hypothetical protein
MGIACWEGRFFITQDLDFSDVRQFQPGTHPGLLLVRLREPGANALLESIAAMIQVNPLESLSGCFVVTSQKPRAGIT